MLNKTGRGLCFLRMSWNMPNHNGYGNYVDWSIWKLETGGRWSIFAPFITWFDKNIFRIVSCLSCPILKHFKMFNWSWWCDHYIDTCDVIVTIAVLKRKIKLVLPEDMFETWLFSSTRIAFSTTSHDVYLKDLFVDPFMRHKMIQIIGKVSVKIYQYCYVLN